jgi:hypothetical protein
MQPAGSDWQADNGWVWNFGQDSSFAGNETAQGNQDGNGIGDFYYTPPTGFLALCTSNLPDVDVVPSEHFNAVLYTGDGVADHAVTVGFQPDFVWLKNRTDAHSHRVIDAVRGDNKVFYSNNQMAEEVVTSTGDDFNFTSTGFTLPSEDASINNDTKNYVSWNWKGGNATSGTGDFTQGSLASTCSRNVDAGFSIVSYEGDGNNGATFGHGLSSTPQIVIVKNRSGSGDNWTVWGGGSSSLFGRLSLNDTASNYTNYNATFSSSLVTMPDYDNAWNGNGNDYIAYCFHSVDGYSKVGSYTGNGSTDGTFVYTGFRPAWVMIKCTTDTESWWVFDNKRNPYVSLQNRLQPNSSDAEITNIASGADNIDFTSNGYKAVGLGGGTNSNNTYIYIAFAETPFKYSNAR